MIIHHSYALDLLLSIMLFFTKMRSGLRILILHVPKIDRVCYMKLIYEVGRKQYSGLENKFSDNDMWFYREKIT